MGPSRSALVDELGLIGAEYIQFCKFDELRSLSITLKPIPGRLFLHIIHSTPTVNILEQVSTEDSKIWNCLSDPRTGTVY